MRIDLTSCTVEELAGYVGSHLTRAGFRAVLTGGSAVSIYTENLHQTHDLDFIVNASNSELDGAMAELGFHRKGSRHYVNPSCIFYVEFPSPPLMLGNEVVTETSVKETPYGRFFVLSPTQSIKDRLAAYFHWNDPQSLYYATLIAERQEIDWPNLGIWAAGEGEMEKYQVFLDRVENIKS